MFLCFLFDILEIERQPWLSFTFTWRTVPSLWLRCSPKVLIAALATVVLVRVLAVHLLPDGRLVHLLGDVNRSRCEWDLHYVAVWQRNP